jgi:hypothetical protein
MKGKWMLESNTTICVAASEVQFFSYGLNEEQQPLVFESNTPLLYVTRATYTNSDDSWIALST